MERGRGRREGKGKGGGEGGGEGGRGRGRGEGKGEGKGGGGEHHKGEICLKVNALLVHALLTAPVSGSHRNFLR